MLYADDLVLVGKCEEEELKEKLRKWNECLNEKGLKINEEKTQVMCESFGTGTTQVVGNVKHPCSVCLQGVGVNSFLYSVVVIILLGDILTTSKLKMCTRLAQN